ncbi:MAG: tryptophan transporter [Dialister invisus]
MEAVKDVSSLIYIKARGGRFRWLTISTLMLAIGMLLHLVSPSVAGFTPNWMIATYVVAILLTKPSYRQCLGICMVAALMEVFTSKSAFPYGDFASEFAGAYVAGFFAHSVPPFKIGRFSLRPAIAGFITTLVSGFIFVSILTVVVGIPISVYLYGILPMVALVE